MLPIRLAWAWTIWKAQGQRCKGKIIVNLGERERTHGLTYVAFSRSRRLSDIAIVGGVYVDRLTTTMKQQTRLRSTANGRQPSSWTFREDQVSIRRKWCNEKIVWHRWRRLCTLHDASNVVHLLLLLGYIIDFQVYSSNDLIGIEL